MSAEQAATLPLEPPAEAGGLIQRHGRRALVFGAPAVYLIALGVTIAAWGLPLARDQLFFWIGLGLLAFSVSAWRSWGVMLLEWLPFFALLVTYDYLRGAVSVPEQLAHVMPQIDVDKFLFFGTVPTVWLQQHLWDPAHIHWYDYGIWVVYMTHFFTVWVVAAVLWRMSRARFRHFAVVTILLTVGAFLTYWLYPAQPPWVAAQSGLIGTSDRIVPLVWGQLGVHTIKSLYENGDFVNTVAAMPSLHAAYPFMLMLFFWSAGVRVRILLGIYTLAMAFTLVYGGEHFVTDILAGWAMAAAVVWLVGLLRKGAWQSHLKRFPARRGVRTSTSTAARS
jgi:membrane-associated phospholipid phosphatase